MDSARPAAQSTVGPGRQRPPCAAAARTPSTGRQPSHQTGAGRCVLSSESPADWEAPADRQRSRWRPSPWRRRLWHGLFIGRPFVMQRPAGRRRHSAAVRVLSPRPRTSISVNDSSQRRVRPNQEAPPVRARAFLPPHSLSHGGRWATSGTDECTRHSQTALRTVTPTGVPDASHAAGRGSTGSDRHLCSSLALILRGGQPDPSF